MCEHKFEGNGSFFHSAIVISLCSPVINCWIEPGQTHTPFISGIFWKTGIHLLKNCMIIYEK